MVSRTPPVSVGEINPNMKSLRRESQSRIQMATCASIFRSLSTRDQQILHLRRLDPAFFDA
jgi:hypothetical protein